MAKLIDRLLPAGTLIEVLISMIIIMVVFALASSIYLQAYKQIPPVEKIAAQLKSRTILNQLKLGKPLPPNLQDSTEQSIEFLAYPGSDSLQLVQVSILKNGETIGSSRGIVIKRSNK